MKRAVHIRGGDRSRCRQPGPQKWPEKGTPAAWTTSPSETMLECAATFATLIPTAPRRSVQQPRFPSIDIQQSTTTACWVSPLSNKNCVDMGGVVNVSIPLNLHLRPSIMSHASCITMKISSLNATMGCHFLLRPIDAKGILSAHSTSL
jgi:hypothetical protein